MSELVSVLVGAYNAERYLGEAIESVFAQTHRPLELIVVDDGSGDGTAAVAAAYGDRLTLIRQARGGNGAARNRAVEAARGGLLSFLDADDRFTPRKLELQRAVLDADPSAEVVFGHVREFVSPDVATEPRDREPGPERPWTAPNLMLIRRPAFERVGPFSETLRVGVTVDWYARAQEAGHEMRMIPNVVLERRLHADNNGVREAASRGQYLEVVKAALDRRRAQAEGEQ